jgi:dynactin 1
VSGVAPWVTRIAEIKATLAINVEAERKAAQLNDEMQGLVRSLKTKDQSIQESTVKIELMERRMEAAKKQAEAILDLEAELSKARKQERAYEEAMEQLQADLDALEQDNAKLKTLTVGQERQGEFLFLSVKWSKLILWTVSGVQQAEPENVPIEGSLETSHLLEQVRTFFGPSYQISFSLDVTGSTDRCTTRYSSLPPNGEFISQRPRSSPRDRVFTSSIRTH